MKETYAQHRPATRSSFGTARLSGRRSLAAAQARPASASRKAAGSSKDERTAPRTVEMLSRGALAGLCKESAGPLSAEQTETRRLAYNRIRTAPSSEQAAKFNTIGQKLTLHKRSHLLTDRTPRTHLWRCSTSLSSLTCFFQRSNQAFIDSTCLFFGLTLPMQSISKPHNQHTPKATYGAMHNSTNKHLQQRHIKRPIHYLLRN